MTLLADLARRQLVVVTGKGGVGKSTVAAALGRLIARAGRRVHLVEIDPRESLHQLLGTEPSGGAVVRVEQRLFTQDLQPIPLIEGVVREKVRLAALARKVLTSPIFQHFIEGAPGLKEMTVLGQCLRVATGEAEPGADCVVLDAPATGHGLTLLTAPLLLGRTIAGGELGEMAAELAEFMADPARCAVVVVTLAEEMPVEEALELVAGLEERAGRRPELLVVNAMYPRWPASGTMPADLGEPAVLWRKRRRINEAERKRLGRSWNGPIAELPLLALPRGPKLLEAIARALEPPLTSRRTPQ